MEKNNDNNETQKRVKIDINLNYNYDYNFCKLAGSLAKDYNKMYFKVKAKHELEENNKGVKKG